MRRAADLLTESHWEPPQWLQIEDLESLVGLGEEYGEDVEVLLTDKTKRLPEQRFDAFLFEHFGTRGWDPLLAKAAMEFLSTTGLRYFDALIGSDPE